MQALEKFGSNANLSTFLLTYKQSHNIVFHNTKYYILEKKIETILESNFYLEKSYKVEICIQLFNTDLSKKSPCP